MNLGEFYQETPVERHPEIVVSGDRLFYSNEEYIISSNGELRLVRSARDLEQTVNRIAARLDVSD